MRSQSHYILDIALFFLYTYVKSHGMPLPIDIESLLTQQKVENSRIEFKESWNNVSVGQIYRSVCAFANDYDNIGGGYIIVGVAEENGVAIRPVKGVPLKDIDKIQKEILNYNNQLSPAYFPKVVIEEVDGKKIVVLWIQSGENRPYKVYQNIASSKNDKGEKRYYIRYANSTIEANTEQLSELLSLKNRIPFDERGNSHIHLNDISLSLIRDHLVKIGSKLSNFDQSISISSLLEHMGLMTGPPEYRIIKNVAGMMFCEEPQRFFPGTRAEIVIFPEGRIKNPNYFIELPTVTGPVPSIITKVLDYLKTHVIKERVIKQKNYAESIRDYNYPYQALEEALVNAFYHRDYQINEPVEVVIEPNRITILSHSGPDKSISEQVLKEASIIRSRRYKNRRLGDFLKELGLTEGRATGIPTIQEELRKNGNPRAHIETDSDRTYFLIDIPGKDNPSQKDNENIPHQSSEISIIRNIFIKAVNNGKYNAKIPSDNYLKLIINVLKIAETPKSMSNLLEVLPKMNRSTVLKNIIQPLIHTGLLERTVESAVTSSNQKYATTILASALLKACRQ